MSSLVDFATNILLFLLWILFVCSRRNVLPKVDREFLVRNLKWGWSFFFRSIDQTKADDVQVNGKELRTRCYEAKLGFEGAVECAVCLCKIEEGDEIRDLRCEHIFHRACLDKWIGLRRLTCPLCRSCLAPRTTPSHEPGEEVLIFNFCSSSSRDRTRWGLL
ncbi:hypothetical protein RJ639_039166 [Escallonia herrerae]|uniref:RING-type domain-containing protein n=1 Tax=Escallonia herrerae TaxID=1293975 RepID=A0AA88WNI5_9ASTE|nr:hypothetical protein RJ639_039166 [Escallonia herrerae]